MGIGVFNHLFFIIGLGWGLLALLVLILRVWAEQKDAPPEEEEHSHDDEQQDDYYQGCDRSDISKLCKFVNFFHLLFLPGNA